MTVAKSPALPKPFEFSLLHNALDFIDSAVESIAGDPQPRDIKYALIHLAMGIELAFKARLSQEHWTLVLTNPGKVTHDEYLAGNCISVDLAEALDRLKNVAGISVSESDRKVLVHLQRLRNRLVHLHAREDTVDAAKAKMVRPLEIVITFISENLEHALSTDVEKSLLRSIRKHLGDFRTFKKKRSAAAKKQLKARGSPETFPCPSCFEDFAILDGGLHCLFCYATATGEAGAWDFASEILGSDPYSVAKGRSENPVFICPECGAESLVDLGDNEDLNDPSTTRFLCLNCDFTAGSEDLEVCVRCNTFFQWEPGDPVICKDCLSELD